MEENFSWLRASWQKLSSLGRLVRISLASHWKWKLGNAYETQDTRSWGWGEGGREGEEREKGGEERGGGGGRAGDGEEGVRGRGGEG